VDLVPVGVDHGGQTLSPLLILWLFDDLDARLTESSDLPVDVVAVEPERDSSGQCNLFDGAQTERERAKDDHDELRLVLREPIVLLEAEVLAIERCHSRQVGRLEDRKRVMKRHAPSLATTAGVTLARVRAQPQRIVIERGGLRAEVDAADIASLLDETRPQVDDDEARDTAYDVVLDYGDHEERLRYDDEELPSDIREALDAQLKRAG
jgi:hypothetical protein